MSTPTGRTSRTGAGKRTGEGSRAAQAAAVAQLADEFWQYWLKTRPHVATYLGDRRYDDQLPDLGPEGRHQDQRVGRRLLARVRAVPPGSLGLEDRLTRATLEESLEMMIAEPDHKLYQWDVNQLIGPQMWFLDLTNYHPLDCPRGFETLVARMTAFPETISQYLDNLREGMAEGRHAARIIVERVIAQTKGILALPPEQNPMGLVVQRVPASWTARTRDRIVRRVMTAVEQCVNPALKIMVEFLESEYVERSRTERIGIWALPRGDRAYSYLIRLHTTTRLKAEEVHDVGLEEVAAIQEEILAIARGMGHRGDLKSFLRKVAGDPAGMARTRQQLLERFQNDLDRATRAAPRYFDRLPRAQVIVKQLEEFRERDAPGAYYYGPAQDGSRPGMFYANTYEPQSRPLYTTMSLTAHETIPGHHLQLGLAQELIHLPALRQHGGFAAYVEGWALYAERLSDEMGLYTDDLSRVGMLTDQCMRACRLVVDTGLHARKWTRDQAIDYMRTNLAMTDVEIVNEVDRYVVWPGQALSYKLGQREISRLRAQAESKLADRFDLKAFHSCVLGHGALPLPVLKLAVADWIKTVRKAPG